MKNQTYWKTAFYVGLIASICHFNQGKAQGIDCNTISSQLADFEIVISDVSQNPLNPLQICSGHAPPIYLSIKDSNHNFPDLNYQNIEVHWFYQNDITGSPSHPFTIGQNAYSFQVPSSDASLFNDLCGITPYTASTERLFKALIKVPDGTGNFCEHLVTSSALKICCPPSNFSLSISLSDDGTNWVFQNIFCETDEYMLAAQINGLTLPWPDQGNNDVQIDWVMFNNSTSMSNFLVNSEGSEAVWPDTGAPALLAGMYLVGFSANVSNCNCPAISRANYFYADREPKCGLIDALALPPNLTPGTPGTFFICPGKDASMGIAAGTSFLDCHPSWEFSYPNAAPGVWHQTSGTSNSVHNTNILPVLAPNLPPISWPPGETCISYRINSNSYYQVCDPCQSNEITICLYDPLPVPVISASPNPFCFGGMTTINIDNLAAFPAGTVFEWFHNGLHIQFGDFLETYVGGNYMVTATGECGITSSNILQPEICKLNAVISCPDPECPCVGETITLDGSLSSSTCSYPFSYSWSADSGTQVSPSNDQAQFQHTPAATGTTYSLTITDANGCSDTKTVFVKPCED